jgi:hypothetical protein
VGCRRLTILSDRYAAAFYERNGAIRTGVAPSDTVPGRMLPLFAIGWIWAQKWLTSCGACRRKMKMTLQLTARQLDDEPVVAGLNATR